MRPLLKVQLICSSPGGHRLKLIVFSIFTKDCLVCRGKLEVDVAQPIKNRDNKIASMLKVLACITYN